MARRKITDTEEDLPDLTPMQMKFCEGVLAGLSNRKAYKAAYGAGSMSNASIDVNASRLRHNAKIALWLDAARYEMLKSHACTLEGHLAELQSLKAIAVRTGNIGAAVQAEQLRGKAAGHYVELHADVSFDPARTLKQIAELEPELARKLAQKHNIPLDQLEPTATRH